MSRARNFIPYASEKNLRPLSLPECVHLTDLCTCGILNVSECMGPTCPFCQLGGESRNSRRNWYRRLNVLSAEKQSEIAALYYGGTMPWKGRTQIGEDNACNE